MLYTALVEIGSNGSASGWFPDVAGCIFGGANFQEAFKDAESALNAHFELLAEKGLPVPEATEAHFADYTQANGKRKPSDRMILIGIEIDMTKYLGKSERINITMPHRLIEKIDKAVSQDSRYTSRSHFIAEAARKELSHL